MNYHESVIYLRSLTDMERDPAQALAPVNFDLGRVESLLARLDSPHLGRRTIHVAGSDLLSLIDDVLDLSKIEAGKMEVQPSEVLLADVREFVRRSFEPLADQKGLGLHVELDQALPHTVFTDQQRLQQVLRPQVLQFLFRWLGLPVAPHQQQVLARQMHPKGLAVRNHVESRAAHHR